MQNFHTNIKKVLILSIQMEKKNQYEKIEQSDQQKLKLSPSASTFQIADFCNFF